MTRAQQGVVVIRAGRGYGDVVVAFHKGPVTHKHLSVFLSVYPSIYHLSIHQSDYFFSDAHIFTNNSFHLCIAAEYLHWKSNSVVVCGAAMNKNMRVIFQGRIMCHWRLFLWSSIALKWGRSDGERWCSMMVLYDRYLPARFRHPSAALPLSFPMSLLPHLASPWCPNTKNQPFWIRITVISLWWEACKHMCKDRKYIWSNAHMGTGWHCVRMVKSSIKISTSYVVSLRQRYTTSYCWWAFSVDVLLCLEIWFEVVKVHSLYSSLWCHYVHKKIEWKSIYIYSKTTLIKHELFFSFNHF